MRISAPFGYIIPAVTGIIYLLEIETDFKSEKANFWKEMMKINRNRHLFLGVTEPLKATGRLSEPIRVNLE